MKKTICRAAFAISALLGAGGASALTLYDASLGTLPSAQGWTTAGLFGPFSESVGGGVWRLDTSALAVTRAGSARPSPQALDTQTGFAVDFTLRVPAESHLSANRAGFSLIVTGQDPTHSLELAFWDDRVFAYAYDAATADRFVHGAEALLDTHSAAHAYRLVIANQQFTLSADGTTLFGGALVDYTPEGAPYTSGNGFFFGDDTSRAASVSEVGRIALSAVPEPAAAALLALGLGVVAALRRRPAR